MEYLRGSYAGLLQTLYLPPAIESRRIAVEWRARRIRTKQQTPVMLRQISSGPFQVAKSSSIDRLHLSFHGLGIAVGGQRKSGHELVAKRLTLCCPVPFDQRTGQHARQHRI